MYKSVIKAVLVIISITLLPFISFGQGFVERPEAAFVPVFQSSNPGNIFVGTGKINLKIKLFDAYNVHPYYFFVKDRFKDELGYVVS